MRLPKRAVKLNEEGCALREQGRADEAAERFEEAIAAAPGWSSPPYNLGLVYKHRKDWERSLEHNRRAAELPPPIEAAWWNLGIAATALGRWDVARQAWRGFGIDVPDGDGPIDLPCGVGPIRLNPDGDGEVVWAQRLDPARAVLLSIPLPESGHCWSDVVLNDGQPVGYRHHQGREVPVFNALQVLTPSRFGTYVARVEMPGEGPLLRRLAEVAAQRGGAAEDWTTSVQIICRACSEGRPHGEHDHGGTPEGSHLIAVAARSRRHATQILRQWAAEWHDVRVESLDDAVVRGEAQ
jgi:tetratricopeptide (TPR) repeat protein